MTICKSPKAEEEYLEVRAQRESGTSDGVERHVGSQQCGHGKNSGLHPKDSGEAIERQ